MSFDIYIVGVGGQGVLTIADIITSVAFKKGISVNYYPTKGMAQRGGFVKAQLRLGRNSVGPNIPEGEADLVVSMEMSESLKAIRFLKPGADFLLYGSKWEPAAVMLGKAPYPLLSVVGSEVKSAGGKLFYIDPSLVPNYEGKVVRDNLFVLGAIFGQTSAAMGFTPEDVMEDIKTRWPKAKEQNLYAFQAGMSAVVTQEV